jgi:hypothetical protein
MFPHLCRPAGLHQSRQGENVTPKLRTTRNGNRQHISCRITDTMHAQLTDIARREKRRISDVYRIALEDFVRTRRVLSPPLPIDDDVVA